MGAALLPVLTGTISTAIIAGGVLPVLLIATRTRELPSNRPGNPGVGNAARSLYLFHLPPGPTCCLHSFYSACSALTLYRFRRCRPSAAFARSGQSVTVLLNAVRQPER
jgi:hypothetical protein